MKSVLAATSPFVGLHVREKPTQDVSNPIAPRQKFEKTFLLEQAGETATAIDHIVVSTPGVTFVSCEEGAAPSVKVSSNEQSAIEAMEVLEHGPTGLEIRLKASPGRHYILTEVALPPPTRLRSVEVRGSGSLVLEDKVLVSDDPEADVSVRLSGSGDIFTTIHSEIHVKSLSLDLAGSGDLQVIAPSLVVKEKFESKIASSGNVRVYAGSISAAQIKLSTAGSGGTHIAALGINASSGFDTSISGSGSITTIGHDLNASNVALTVAGSGDTNILTETSFAADTVSASVSGSGSINVASANARCDRSEISLAGSGTVDARDLLASHAQVDIAGSGNVLLRIAEAARSYVGGSGSMTIVGDLPPQVSGTYRSKTELQKPSKLEQLAEKRRRAIPAPTKVDAFEKLHRFNGTIDIHSFSEFLGAVKMLWNRGMGDHVEIRYRSGDDSRSP